jgi:biofilm PGA synthesis N-glycosyltransferase PgaC
MAMPEFSIIIATAGEPEAAIAHKLENTLALNRSHSFEVLIFSDGQSLPDSLARDSSVSSHNFPRQGKTACQNQCAERAKGAILVFTDVTADLAPDCLEALAGAFANEKAAAVGGQFEYRFKSANAEGGYLSVEHVVKNLQSHLGVVIGYFGPLYSVRRELYQAMPSFYCSDLMLPLMVINQNHLALFEPRAGAGGGGVLGQAP